MAFAACRHFELIPTKIFQVITIFKSSKSYVAISLSLFAFSFNCTDSEFLICL